MKLTFSPASPFARKVRIAAIELGLIDRIEFVPATVVPGQPNDEYAQINPVKKLPVLILDNGDVVLEFLRDRRISRRTRRRRQAHSDAGATQWKVKSDHSLLQGMLNSMLLCRYERMVRPQGLQWQAWTDDHWNRAWQRHGAVREAPRHRWRGRSTSPRLRSSACSAMPISALPIAAGARPTRSSTPSIGRCWNGPRSRSRYRRRHQPLNRTGSGCD